MMLFKYSNITDYFKINLRERQIWFSAPCDFNDVDDSALRIDWQLTDEDIWNEFIFIQRQIYHSAMVNKDYSNGPVVLENAARQYFLSILADRGPDGVADKGGNLRASVTRALEWRRQTLGICCFSQDNLNRLLWSHYADGDRGVCIGIETTFDSQCFPKLEVVNYVDALPKIKLLSHMMTNLITLYTTKSSEWSYEREIRAFQHTRGNYRMDPQCLVSCFFGERASPDDVNEIRDIVRDKYGKQVGLLKMIRGLDGEREFRPLPD
jgi:hypothetical protein